MDMVIDREINSSFFPAPELTEYKAREFALWIESYGGHYDPMMAS